VSSSSFYQVMLHSRLVYQRTIRIMIFLTLNHLKSSNHSLSLMTTNKLTMCLNLSQTFPFSHWKMIQIRFRKPRQSILITKARVQVSWGQLRIILVWLCNSNLSAFKTPWLTSICHLTLTNSNWLHQVKFSRGQSILRIEFLFLNWWTHNREWSRTFHNHGP